MSNSAQHEEQPNSQNYLNNPGENSNMPFRLQLSPQQASYLIKHLPTNYSFQLQTKPLKRSVSTAKNVKEPTKTASETRKKPVKVILQLLSKKPKVQEGKVVQLVKKLKTMVIHRKLRMLSMKNTALKRKIEELLSKM